MSQQATPTALGDSEIKEKARQKVIDDYGLSPDSGTDVEEEEEPTWQEDFRGNDHTNPNHILKDGEVLCGSISADDLIPHKLFLSTRELLLHPASNARSPESYCQTCLASFRKQYDFNLDEEDLHCPECGSQMKSYTDPRDGTYKCDACNWEY